jgi:hypothetical protein
LNWGIVTVLLVTRLPAEPYTSNMTGLNMRRLERNTLFAI